MLAFHPVQPWLAYADVYQGLTVWDWSSQQVIIKSTALTIMRAPKCNKQLRATLVLVDHAGCPGQNVRQHCMMGDLNEHWYAGCLGEPAEHGR